MSMAKEKIRLENGKVPTDSVLYALERTNDFLRADYNSGVAFCDPVEDCFAPLLETLVRDILENDQIEESDRSAFASNLKAALKEYLEKLER